MRPAIEVATQICGCADARQRKSDIALIEADRAEARAEVVEEIVAWLRDEANGWMCADTASSEIEAKFGGRDGH